MIIFCDRVRHQSGVGGSALGGGDDIVRLFWLAEAASSSSDGWVATMLPRGRPSDWQPKSALSFDFLSEVRKVVAEGALLLGAR